MIYFYDRQDFLAGWLGVQLIYDSSGQNLKAGIFLGGHTEKAAETTWNPTTTWSHWGGLLNFGLDFASINVISIPISIEKFKLRHHFRALDCLARILCLSTADQSFGLIWSCRHTVKPFPSAAGWEHFLHNHRGLLWRGPGAASEGAGTLEWDRDSSCDPCGP